MVVDKSTVDGCLKGVSLPVSKDEVAERPSGTSCPGKCPASCRTCM